jgi:hypothetical protein
MLEAIRRRARTNRIGRAIEESIHSGVGLHHNQWSADSSTDRPVLSRVASELVEWCKSTIARTKRPHGIDHLAVAIACAHPGGEPVTSATFGVFRPIDFYREGGVGDSLASFVTGLDPAAFEADRPIRFAAALFSWGDVAHATVFAEE